jgi:malonate transporter and related proteins
MGLGCSAAWRHEFSAEQASVMNKMVLLYAVPLLLFAGTVTIKRDQLTADLGLAAAIAVAILGAYLLAFLIARFALRRSRGLSVLTGLAVGGPAIPFVGVVVLGYLYGAKVSALPVAIGALVINVVQVPVTLLLLSLDAAVATPADAPMPRVMTRAQDPAHQPTAEPVPTMAAVGTSGTVHAGGRQAAPMAGAGLAHEKALARAGQAHLAQNLTSTAEQPIVWAPMLALVLVLAGISLPRTLVHALTLSGSASTGVAGSVRDLRRPVQPGAA